MTGLGERCELESLNQWSKERLYYSELATKHMIQGLNAIKEIKVLGREKEFISKFVSNNNFMLVSVIRDSECYNFKLILSKYFKLFSTHFLFSLN